MKHNHEPEEDRKLDRRRLRINCKGKAKTKPCEMPGKVIEKDSALLPTDEQEATNKIHFIWLAEGVCDREKFAETYSLNRIVKVCLNIWSLKRKLRKSR